MYKRNEQTGVQVSVRYLSVYKMKEQLGVCVPQGEDAEEECVGCVCVGGGGGGVGGGGGGA